MRHLLTCSCAITSCSLRIQVREIFALQYILSATVAEEIPPILHRPGYIGIYFHGYYVISFIGF